MILLKGVFRFAHNVTRCRAVSQITSGGSCTSICSSLAQSPVIQTKCVIPCLLQGCRFLSTGRSSGKPPKKPLTSFFLFRNEHYPTLARDNPGSSVTEISKQIGQMWKTLPVQERDKYVSQAQEDLKQYKQMFDGLSKEEQVDIKEHRADRVKRLKLFRKKKQLKALNKPKRPGNMYTLFLTDKMAERGTMPPREYFRQMAGEWRMMSDQEKQPYKDRSANLQDQYRQDMMKWEKKMKAEGHPELIRGYKPPSSRKPKKRIIKKKTKTKKAKPRKKRVTKRKASTSTKKTASKLKKPTAKKKTEKKSEDATWMREE